MSFIFPLILKILVVVGAGFVGYMTPKLLKRNDTPIEQIAEKIIKEETGYEIDFSPEEIKEKALRRLKKRP